ncbi:importin subunit alpha-1b [Hordeum vulgare]|nr:importin subunit alpha-1b [Hordeum vulgare]
MGHSSALPQKLDNSVQLEAITQFRKLLSIERSPPIEEVINIGVVPCFIEFLRREDYAQLQFEAVWMLTNIAAHQTTPKWWLSLVLCQSLSSYSSFLVRMFVNRLFGL